MQLANDGDGYGAVSIMLHWAGAATVLIMLATAAWAFVAPNEEAEGNRLMIHGSFGVLLYLLLAARIVWHFAARQPKPLSRTPVLRAAASVVHVALLLLIIVQLVTGPLAVWSGGWPIGLFDWLAIPSPLGGSLKAWHDPIGDVHRFSGYTIALLFGVHVAAALKHLLIDRDQTVQRMLGLARERV